MSTDFKQLFHARTPLVEYRSKVWRLVEDQEIAATLNVVDNMAEHELLEALLDAVKPPYRAGTEKMHYLLKTAFRYPPLRYGSRFGTQTMPSFFYAAEDSHTALAETAYYRFVFLSDMQTPYPHPIDSQYSLFNVTVNTTRGLDLYSKRYTELADELADPGDYRLTQKIGRWATEDRGVALIRFESARRRGTANVAINEPAAIISKQPNGKHNWLCRTLPTSVSFNSREAKLPISFSLDYFLVDGRLPRPA